MSVSIQLGDTVNIKKNPKAELHKNGAARRMYKLNSNVCWVGKIVRDTR